MPIKKEQIIICHDWHDAEFSSFLQKLKTNRENIYENDNIRVTTEIEVGKSKIRDYEELLNMHKLKNITCFILPNCLNIGNGFISKFILPFLKKSKIKFFVWHKSIAIPLSLYLKNQKINPSND